MADDDRIEETPATAPEHDSKTEGKSSGPLMGVLAFLLALGLGFGIGRIVQDDGPSARILDDDTRYLVRLRGDEPQQGPDDALITVIEFADYQCPYCARAREPIEKALAKLEDDARLIYKHFPLPGHPLATPAAKAAWAAHQQGKFWEMHAALFEANASVKEIGVRAEAMGMDRERFLRDFASVQAATAVDEDLLAGARLGVTGTPVFYVNGHRYVGFRDESQWDDVLEFEVENAEALIDAGTPRAELYAKLMEGAVDRRGRTKADRAPSSQQRPGGLDPAVVYAIDVEGRPALGPEDALVTVAVFSDFQCPYCAKLAPVLKQLVETEGDVRVVFMQLPIPSHRRARDAARAALAAGQQGKFWEMHDRLFEKRSALSGADFATWGPDIGLDASRFEADLVSTSVEQTILADERLAKALKLSSTPSTFVNGRYVRGAVSLGQLRAKVAEERALAQARVDSGTALSGVYAAIMAEADVTP